MFMELDGLLNWLFETAIAGSIRENDWLFPMLESLHVLGVTVFLGSIIWVDLRILRFANNERRLQKFVNELLPITWLMFLVAVVTGFALFTSNAVNYAHNIFFQLKILFLTFAGLNMIIFHVWYHNKVLSDDLSYPSPLIGTEISNNFQFRDLIFKFSFWAYGRWSAVLSVVFWIFIIALGRWIGFSIQPTFSG